MKVLKIVDDVLTKILRWFVTTMCIGIGLILFFRVLIRFTPVVISISWTDEVVEWMMAWMIFTGATILVRNGDHFRVDLMQTKFEGRTWMDILNILISLMSIAFFTALLYYSIRLVEGAIWFSPILKVSTQVPYMSMPVNCGIILMYLLRDLVVGFADMIKHRRTAAIDVKSESI